MKIKYKFLSVALLLAASPAMAQQLRSGYIDWGVRGTAFPAALDNWQKGKAWSSDDNFFISRVKPKMRFRNQATQVDPSLSEENDKKLMFWVPVNTPEFNALPDGAFDREVFPMWSYVTHYGNWSTSLVRMPGNFMDVAHKNGVPVSVVASVPWGNISSDWNAALKKLAEVGAPKMADFLTYYGVDGLGYNSEFRCSSTLVAGIRDFHSELVAMMRPKNPLFENIWYDGTNDNGVITFDQGLYSLNKENFGSSESPRSSLFFNYNWNSTSLMQASVDNARAMGRSPLDLYCGINMQGGEPKSGERWPLLAKYPLSIGLWGAHSANMFFESRNERGASPLVAQRTYLERVEKWFSGGTRNPVNSLPLSNSLKYGAECEDFFGMAKLMSARSSLKWNLSDEPFVTCFNLGNGRFFNFRGVRCNDNEWYNIGVQDYLPTWMWWFASSFMGRNPEDVPSAGLDAEFTWDDAWLGGSSLRVFGSASHEYLHLFKTEFVLRRGDVITVRYKLKGGSAKGRLVLSAKGAESTPVAADKMVFMKPDDSKGSWLSASFRVDDALSELDGKEIAMVALEFLDAENVDLRLGEFSIVRGSATSAVPAVPVLEKAEVLAAGPKGADGKVIFHMPNDKPAGEVCYNLDVKTSLFKLYAREEGGKVVMMGMTPSWAGMIFSAPFSAEKKNPRVSFGVSALSLDMSRESEIAWSDWMEVNDLYEVSDEIVKDKSVVVPGEPFSVSYADSRHAPASWSLLDSEGKVAASSANDVALDCSGLSLPGHYSLRVDGKAMNAAGEMVDSVRVLSSFVQVIGEEAGRLPEIRSFGLADNVAPSVAEDESLKFVYEGNGASGRVSRGIKLNSGGLGFPFSETGYVWKEPFSVSFWFKPEATDMAQCLMNIRSKNDSWPVNTWGLFYNTLDAQGRFDQFVFRCSPTVNANYHFRDAVLQKDVWQHLTYVFDFNEDGNFFPSLYINGRRCELEYYTFGDEKKSGDEMDYVPTQFRFRSKNVFSIGGALHTMGSALGNVDNFMFFRKALSSDEVKEAMRGDFSDGNMPESLSGYFDFEDELSDGRFVNKGKDDFQAGLIGYVDDGLEGQSNLFWKQPEFCAGSPFVAGNTGWEVVTAPEWTIDGGYVVSAEGDGGKGSAIVRFSERGHHNVQLSLVNDYGVAARTMEVNVTEAGVESIISGPQVKVYPSPFTDTLNVTFETGDIYQVTLTAADGRKILSQTSEVSDGETLTLAPKAPAGLCLLTITPRRGTPLTIKLLSK